MIPQLPSSPIDCFPDTREALEQPNGLLAWGGDLSLPRLLAAYRRGIFPWFADDEPILWWSPAPRCVLLPGNIHLSRRLKRTLKNPDWEVHGDRDFVAVMEGCSDREETWITDAMKTAYRQLHQTGHAHSVEIWRGNSLLAGVYGIAMGRMFFAESMFHRETDMSKVALLALSRGLEAAGFAAIDCQVSNPHLLRMGAQEVSREVFQEFLWTTEQPCPIEDWPGYFGSLPLLPSPS